MASLLSSLSKGSDAIDETPYIATKHCNQCWISGKKLTATAFCKSCFNFLCVRCKINHRNSQKDHQIVTGNLEQCVALIRLKKDVSIALQELVQTENEASENIELADLYRDNAFEAIQKERENINNMFEEQKERINAELDTLEIEVKDTIIKKYTDDQDKFESIIQETKSLRADLENITSKQDDVQETGSESNFFSTIDIARQEMTQLKPKVRQAGAQNEVTKYRFEPKWQQSFTKMAITNLGTIQILDSTLASAAVCPILDINVRGSSDNDFCTIRGMCFVSDLFLVVADSQNKMLKVLSREDYRVVSQVAMPSSPRDVTKVKDNQIAVTLPSKHLIQILKMSNTNTLIASHDIDVDGSCRGIAYFSGKLVVSFDFPTSHIEILDMKGKVLQKVEPNKSVAGRTSYGSIGISPDHKTIYVVDDDQETLTSIATTGKVKAIYRNKHLQKPKAVTVDSNGFVYVSGMAKVHELSADLSRRRVILDRSHGIHCVQSLIHCDNQNAIFVGMLQRDIIKVFKVL